jgi:hypothetical protein
MREVRSTLMNILRKSTTHRFRASVVLLCTLCFAAVLPLSAGQINIFDTGVNGAGVALSGGAADTHWQCLVNCNGNAFQGQSTATLNFPLPSTQETTPGSGPWMASTLNLVHPVSPVSQWISFQSNVNTGPNALTEYDYTQTFDLSTFIATTLELKGFFAVDDTVLNILINGNVVTGFTNSGSASAPTPFDILSTSCGGSPNSCGLVNGSNTITFRTEQTPVAGTGLNPTGLLVEFNSATADSSVPEPATLVGVGLGLSLLGLVYRRRRSSIFV